MQDAELKRQLPRNFGYSPMYRLRWVFHFADGRVKTGAWNGTSQNPQDMAAYVDKTGLLWACIEGEKVGAWTTKELARIEGQDYMTTNWRAALNAPAFGDKDYVAPGAIVALEMVGRKSTKRVFVDGTVQEVQHSKEPQLNTFQHRIGV